MLASQFYRSSIPVEFSAYYEFGQSSQENNNNVIEGLEEIIKTHKKEEVKSREIWECSGIEEFEDGKGKELVAGKFHSREWSKMIEESVKSQDWKRIMDFARFNPVEEKSCEIEEVIGDSFMDDISDNQIYVAVGKDPCALQWALNHLVKQGDLATLIHVFPPLKSIPTPVGKLPISQVSLDIVENHMKEEEIKRTRLLQSYLDMCLHVKAKTDTVVIESDMPHKSLVELISVLNISKLVMGTKPATHPMTRKLKKKGQSKADYVHKHAPHFCEVIIVCEGKSIIPKYSESSPTSISTISRHHVNEEAGEDVKNCMGFYRRLLR